MITALIFAAFPENAFLAISKTAAISAAEASIMIHCGKSFHISSIFSIIMPNTNKLISIIITTAPTFFSPFILSSPYPSSNVFIFIISELCQKVNEMRIYKIQKAAGHLLLDSLCFILILLSACYSESKAVRILFRIVQTSSAQDRQNSSHLIVTNAQDQDHDRYR